MAAEYSGHGGERFESTVSTEWGEVAAKRKEPRVNKVRQASESKWHQNLDATMPSPTSKGMDRDIVYIPRSTIPSRSMYLDR